MKTLQYLIIHCTDTPQGRPVTKRDLERWHLSPKPKGRGWSRLGYSDMIHINGEVENLTPYNENDIVENSEITWGSKGFNAISRHVVVVGGRTKNNKHPLMGFINEDQYNSLLDYCKKTIEKHPHIKIGGHYHFSTYKTCPNFDVETFLRINLFPEQNILTNNKSTLFNTVVKE